MPKDEKGRIHFIERNNKLLLSISIGRTPNRGLVIKQWPSFIKQGSKTVLRLDLL